MSDENRENGILNRLVDARIDRRSLIKRIGLGGISAAAMVTLLAACETDDDDVDPVEEPDDDDVDPVEEPDDDDVDPVEEPDDDDDEEPDDPAGERQVHVVWTNPRTMGPLFSTAAFEQTVQRLIFGALVVMNDELEPQPDLAETVEMSEDATVFTFTLKEGITFNDGESLTVDDVVFTFERAIDPQTGSFWHGRLIGIEGAEEFAEGGAESISGLETPDDRTIEITLSRPNATFLFVLVNFSGLGILPKHVVEEIEPDALQDHSFTRVPTVSAGAFQMVSFEDDQLAELEQNPHYGHGPTPEVDRIFMRILETDTAIVELSRGNLDIMGGIPVAEVEALEENPEVDVVRVPGAGTARLQTNLTRPVFEDKRVRQAMQYAIDRESIINDILQGGAQLINHPFIMEWMDGVEGINEYPYDPDTARDLLDEANWDSSQVLEWVFPTGNPELDAMAPIVQEQFQAVGIEVELIPVAGEEAHRRLIELEFDLTVNMGGGMFRSDPNEAERFFTRANFTPAGANFSHFEDERVEELFPMGAAEGDQDERREIYAEIARILNDECPWIWLWSPDTIWGVNQRLSGFLPPPHSANSLWNAEDWSISG